MKYSPQDVLDFWFKELTPREWFQPSGKVDGLVHSRFQGLHKHATFGELYPWRSNAHGRLAEIIVLDQFSRNLYRNSPLAFRYDGMALILAQELIAQKLDDSLENHEKAFAYMPFMHSESLVIHEKALALFSKAGLENNLEYEVHHKKVLERFGRYPHRNEILGRTSTPDELEFLRRENIL